MTPAGSEPSDVGQDGRAALTVAQALEQLVAVIDRELNAEAYEGVAPTDPAWLSVLTRASVSS
jgi:hypothetical protein